MRPMRLPTGLPGRQPFLRSSRQRPDRHDLRHPLSSYQSRGIGSGMYAEGVPKVCPMRNCTRRRTPNLQGVVMPALTGTLPVFLISQGRAGRARCLKSFNNSPGSARSPWRLLLLLWSSETLICQHSISIQTCETALHRFIFYHNWCLQCPLL